MSEVGGGTPTPEVPKAIMAELLKMPEFSLVKTLSDETDLEDIEGDIHEIGYPASGGC